MSDRERIIKAVTRLTEALFELVYTDRISITPDVRLTLSPGIEHQAKDAHTIGLTADVAELLADVIEQLVIDRSVSVPADFYAHIFALAKPQLADEIDAAFLGLDLDELTRDVLDSTPPAHRMTMTRALDAMFGDLGDDLEDGNE